MLCFFQHKSTLLYCMLPRQLKLSSHNNNCNVFHAFYLIGIDLLQLSMCMFYMYLLFKCWFCLLVGFFFKCYGSRILHKHESGCSMSSRPKKLNFFQIRSLCILVSSVRCPGPCHVPKVCHFFQPLSMFFGWVRNDMLVILTNST